MKNKNHRKNRDIFSRGSMGSVTLYNGQGKQGARMSLKPSNVTQNTKRQPLGEQQK